MIKYIKLRNFQKHKNLDIDLSSGINIIHGRTGAGKSCVRRAIEMCLFNIMPKGAITQGEKQCSVEIGIGDISVTRVRSKTINRYVLKIGDDEKTYDSIGKTIPDDVKKAININNLSVDSEEIILNSQPQMGLPFLFDKAPSFRAKILNKLTGNDVLDTLFGGYNKDILKCQREVKRETEILEKRQSDISEKEIKKEKNEVIYNKLKKLYKKAEESENKLCKLLEIKDLLDKTKDNISENKILLNSIKIPETNTLEQLIDKITKLESLKTSLQSTSTLLNDTNHDYSKITLPNVNYSDLTAKINRLSSLVSIKSDSIQINKEKLDIESLNTPLPDVNISKVSNKFDRYNKLLKIKQDLDNSNKMLYTLIEKINADKEGYEKDEIEYKSILKKLGVCPLCNSILKDDKCGDK